MTRSRKIVAGGLAALVLVGAGVPVALGDNTPDPTFKVLKRAARAQDKLPPNSGSGPLGGIDPATVRLVGSIDGHDVYLAPGPDDTVCLLDVDQAGAVGGTCTARDTIKDQPVYSAWRDGSSDTATVAVPVPDAYDAVRIDGQPAAVNNNVALGHAHVGQGTIRLSGQDTLEGDLSLPASK